MRFKALYSLILLLSLLFMALGCQTINIQQETKNYPKPTFDQSHAILIDKTVNGLPIVSTIRDYVKKDEKIVIACIEKWNSGDKASNYLIDDNFILNLVSEGYRVLERDDHMIIRILPEQTATYKRSLLGTIPTPPGVVILDSMEMFGPDYLSNLTTAELSDLYRQLKDDYAIFDSQNSRMETANVILSYRLLECGIVCHIEKKQQGNIDIKTGKEDALSPKLWTYDIKRDSLVRLFVRVMDAKTGEIRIAKTVQNQLTDVVTLKQDKEESDPAFFARIDEYLLMLSKYHYTFYDQQLPNQNNYDELLITITDTTKKIPANSGDRSGND